MKILFYNLLLFLLPVICTAQDLNVLLAEAARLETSSEERAFLKYQEILKLQPAHLAALCKSSELCSSIGHRQPSKDQQRLYYTAARQFASRALHVNAASSEANFVMAIAIGRMTLLLNGKEKVEAVDDIKRYAELSIKCDPQNYKPYHVLARWHYEVSNLSGIERALAKLFYKGLPPASLQEAIYNYEKCRSLVPDLKVNYLELAKCYHRNDEGQKAIDMLTKAIAMPDKMQDDARVNAEAKALLKKWN